MTTKKKEGLIEKAIGTFMALLICDIVWTRKGSLWDYALSVIILLTVGGIMFIISTVPAPCDTEAEWTEIGRIIEYSYFRFPFYYKIELDTGVSMVISAKTHELKTNNSIIQCNSLIKIREEDKK